MINYGRHLVISLLFILIHLHSNGSTLLLINYESRTVSSGNQKLSVEGPSASDAMSVDCGNARSGQCSLRTKLVRNNDYISFGSHRSEQNTINLPLIRYSQGDRFRYQFSLMVPVDWEFDSRDSIDIIWQFKRFGPRPDMFIAIKGNEIVLRHLSERQTSLVKSIPLGQWMDFQLDIFWSANENGKVLASVHLPASKGYLSIVELSGKTMFDARPESAFLKWGLYKPGYDKSITKNPRILFHDDIYVERLK